MVRVAESASMTRDRSNPAEYHRSSLRKAHRCHGSSPHENIDVRQLIIELTLNYVKLRRLLFHGFEQSPHSGLGHRQSIILKKKAPMAIAITSPISGFITLNSEIPPAFQRRKSSKLSPRFPKVISDASRNGQRQSERHHRQRRIEKSSAITHIPSPLPADR